MKKLLLLGISFVLFQSLALANDDSEKKIPKGGETQAGEVSSGGGSAIVCRDDDGVISAPPQVLDLYESKLTLPVPTGELTKDYINGARRAHYLMGKDTSLITDEVIIKELYDFFKIAKFTDLGERLELVNDIGSSFLDDLPRGCLREQVAIYYDKSPQRGEYAIINTEIWGKMDSLNKAALITHENIYRYERTLGEKNSFSSRQSVAHMYSTDDIESAMSGIPKEHMVCLTNGGGSYGLRPSKATVFYVYETEEGFNLQFTKLMGRTILEKAAISWSGTLDLQKGDPTGSQQHDKLVVWEKGSDRVVNIRLKGSQYDNLFLQLDYKYNKSFKISLHR